MFGNKELQEKVSELKELNTSLSADNESLKEKVESFSSISEELEAAKASNEELKASVADYKEKFEALGKEFEDFKANNSAASEAVNILAQAGHEVIEEVAKDPSSSEPSISDLQAKAKSSKNAVEKFEINSEILKSLEA